MTIAQSSASTANALLIVGIAIFVIGLVVVAGVIVCSFRYDWAERIPGGVLIAIFAFSIITNGILTTKSSQYKENAAAHTKEYSYSTHEEAQAKFNELSELDGVEMFHIVENSDNYWGLCYDDNHVPQSITKYYDKIRVEDCEDGHLVVTYTEYQPTDVAENNKNLYQAQLDAVKMLKE